MERRTFFKAATAIAASGLWQTSAFANTASTQSEDNAVSGDTNMSNHTHQTAPTQFVEANGIRFAYRRFGKKQGIPLLFNIHIVGNMDSWDPAVTDGLAQGREVILFDNAGVASSSGEVPRTFAEMAADAGAFIDALGLTKVDVLGFSIGSMIAQNIALERPSRCRQMLLSKVRSWLFLQK